MVFAPSSLASPPDATSRYGVARRSKGYASAPLQPLIRFARLMSRGGDIHTVRPGRAGHRARREHGWASTSRMSMIGGLHR